MYTAKYALNKFRNNKGYNTGKYSKIWKNGVEDNEVLLDLIGNTKIIDKSKIPDIIYSNLEILYDRL